MAEDRRMILRGNDRRNVTPFDLWSGIDDVFDSFRRDMDSFLMNPWSLQPIGPSRTRNVSHYMPMNVKDREDHLELSVEMPGVKKDDIVLSLDDGILTLGVESEENKNEEEEGFLLRERSSYSCKRSIKLPIEVKEDEVEARMEDGVLQIKLPKVHPRKKEKIEIKVN